MVGFLWSFNLTNDRTQGTQVLRGAGPVIRFSMHQATHRDEVILDMDLEYSGDLVVLLEATLLNDNLPPVKASLSNLTLSSARMRVHLRPLLVDVPFVGSITISFLDTPELDFDLGGLANVFDMPGVSLLLRHVSTYISPFFEKMCITIYQQAAPY